MRTNGGGAMSGIDGRIVAVLEDLARLGRRIGERAAELALLAETQGVESRRASADVVGAAALVADQAASLAGSRTRDRAARAAARRSPGRQDADPPAVPRPPVAGAWDHDPEMPDGERVVIADPGARAKRAVSGERTPSLRTRGASRAASRAGIGPSRGVPAGRRMRKRGPQRPKPRLFGAVAASGVVHLLVLVVLACFMVAIDAEPVRIALTLGETTGPESPLDETAPLDMAVAETPDPATDEVADEVPLDEPSLAEELESLLEPQSPERSTSEAASAEDPPAGAVAAPAPGGAGEVGGAAGRRLAAAAPRGSATFFGRQGTARSVCFLCDNSNSYRDGAFHRVLDEIARAVDGLAPQQSFFVIFFSDAAYPLFHPSAVETLQVATPENKRKVRKWLETVEMCRGGRGIDDALRLAGTLNADAIYLLSDGELGGSVVERLASADVGESVLHTFGLQGNQIDRRTGLPDPERIGDQRRRNAALITIATAHGGTFTPVAVPPKAAVLEKIRPIRRNRSRGPVWGLGL